MCLASFYIQTHNAYINHTPIPQQESELFLVPRLDYSQGVNLTNIQRSVFKLDSWFEYNQTNICFSIQFSNLTHWGRVTHICIGKLTIIGSDYGLPPGWCQAIIWTSARILLIGTLRTNFREILIEIQIISFRKMPLKMSSGKWRPFISASVC